MSKDVDINDGTFGVRLTGKLLAAVIVGTAILTTTVNQLVFQHQELITWKAQTLVARERAKAEVAADYNAKIDKLKLEIETENRERIAADENLFQRMNRKINPVEDFQEEHEEDIHKLELRLAKIIFEVENLK